MEETSSAADGEQLTAGVLLLMHTVCLTCALSLTIVRDKYSFGQAHVPFRPRPQSLSWRFHSVEHLATLFLIFCCPGSGCPGISSKS